MGTWRPRTRHISSTSPPGISLRELGALLDHRRLHQPGQDRIHPDALVCIFDRGGPGEVVERDLGCVLGGVQDAAVTDRGSRRDVND
jgi:hypothetical protein